ncbi:MAG: c-type cytochrome [Actinomycetota bacterium]
METMLAITTGQALLLAIGGSVLLLAGVVTLVLRGRRKQTGPDIPTGMRPGPSDADLETPLLQKLQGWGVVLVAFFVVWIPMIWLQEPTQNQSQEEALVTQSIERGSRGVMPFTEDNQLGVGCTRCHGPELKGGLPVPGGPDEETGEPTYLQSADLTTVCQRLLVVQIEDVIINGRPPGMPAWSINTDGALTDQQIADLRNYLIEINEETVPEDQNLCTNEELIAEKTAELDEAGTLPLGLPSQPKDA